MAQNAILTYQPNSPAMPSGNEWNLMLDMAKSLVPTGFLPDTIKTPQQAVAIMLKGRELGVPPMYALSNIVIVKGKPSISAEMMLALIYRDHGKRAIRVKDSTNTACTVEYRLDGWSDVSAYTFTIDDATKAGLTRNQTWSSYPAAMLRARCISAVARMAFPESIAGMYVPGELGDAVTVNDDGEVVHVDAGEIREPATVTALPTPKADDSAVNRRLHAKASHDALHAWAESRGFASLREVPIDDKVALADAFDIDGMADRFRVKYEPAPEIDIEPMPDDDPLSDSLDAQQADLINDPELQAAADRIQRADRARA